MGAHRGDEKKYHDARQQLLVHISSRTGRCATPTTVNPGHGGPAHAQRVPGGRRCTNVCCVVTRYFGGILLGAGGLVRAYTQSAKDALDAAGISVVRRWVETLVPCPYSLLERLKSETAAWGGVIPETEYGADVTLTVLLPEEKAEAYLAHILDMTAGTVEGIATGERFQDVPWRPAGGAGGPG